MHRVSCFVWRNYKGGWITYKLPIKLLYYLKEYTINLRLYGIKRSCTTYKTWSGYETLAWSMLWISSSMCTGNRLTASLKLVLFKQKIDVRGVMRVLKWLTKSLRWKKAVQCKRGSQMSHQAGLTKELMILETKTLTDIVDYLHQ